jgi:penicillin V acylase-like amidase (Ntn superfamily)
MHYQGDYSTHYSQSPKMDTEPAWACTLFAASGDEENPLYGRNFDWRYSPALLLFTDPPDGYASVSMVDIAYLDFENKAENVAELPLIERQALLQAPYLPFDGMNEYGLAIGMAAVPESKMPQDTKKPTIDSLGIMREILDHSRTVDEAVDIIEKYNIEWGGGPALHYLIADTGGGEFRSGKSVLVEFYDGKKALLPNDNPWHLATNHLRVTSQGDGGCYRYAQARQQLDGNSGKLTHTEAFQLLSSVSQAGDYPTQWSIVYGMSTGEIEVVMGREYELHHTFHLPMAGK